MTTDTGTGTGTGTAGMGTQGNSSSTASDNSNRSSTLKPHISFSSRPGDGESGKKNQSKLSSPCLGLSRTVVLRVLLTCSLVAAISTCTAVSYKILKDAEQEVGRQTYISIAASALNGAQAITKRKLQGSEVMSALMSQVFPNKADWPLISMEGYIPIASSVAKLAASMTQ